MNSIKDKIDKTGNKYGMLYVKKLISETPLTYLCECDCGNEKEILSDRLIRSGVKSCGCLKKTRGLNSRINIIGDKYNSLTVIEEIEGRGDKRYFNCMCDCGKTHVASMSNLRTNQVKSCGCLLSKTTIDRCKIDINDLIGKKYGDI